MYKRFLFSMGIMFLMFIFLSSFAMAVPEYINYQGRLTDPNGLAQKGNYEMGFFLYNTKTGGRPVWKETQTVRIVNGIYNVQLGTVNPLSIELFNSDPLYLEVRIGEEILSPRHHLTSTPFAMKAGVADKAGDADTIDGIQSSALEESAEIDTDISIHTDISDAHHTKTISFGDLKDMAEDNQIPDNITVDYAKDADKVDGKHASEFADTHSLDAVDGSPVDVVYVNGIGNVGIGTNSPVYDLDVRGTIDVTNTNDKPGDAYGILIHHKATNDMVGRRKYSLYIEQDGDFSGGAEKSYGHGINIQGVNGADQNIGLRIYRVGSSISDPVGSVNYGLRIEDVQTNGGQSYAIYVDAYDDSYLAGNLGIGTNDPKGKLDVNGEIYQRGTRIHADYVFEPKYKLESIEEHAESMWSEKHLKAIPKAKKDKNGQDIVEYGSHIRGMLEELEKAHVYIAQLNDMIKKQQKTIALLSEKVEKLENQF